MNRHTLLVSLYLLIVMLSTGISTLACNQGNSTTGNYLNYDCWADGDCDPSQNCRQDYCYDSSTGNTNWFQYCEAYGLCGSRDCRYIACSNNCGQGGN